MYKRQHPSLVALIGYCVERRKVLQKKATVCSLVLEFMAGGSLLARLRPTHADPPPLSPPKVTRRREFPERERPWEHGGRALGVTRSGVRWGGSGDAECVRGVCVGV